jgi:D-threonate/D-erythronate kinase
MRIRIITDDFSSALDGTACFAQRGWDADVQLGTAGEENVVVASIDTRTRENVAGSAGDAVYAAARAWSNADLLVLQFDSTLRGRVALDCLSALAASGRRKLLIVPAFPAAGRTTRAGRVYADGVLVHESAFGRDPTLPVRESSVPALFKTHDVCVAVARDAAHTRVLLETHDAVVVDAQTENELDTLVETFATRADVLWAGSTGMLRAMARVLPVPADSGAKGLDSAVNAAQRPLLVVGSLNPRSRLQLEAVQSSRHIQVLATREVRSSPRSALHDVAHQAADLLRSGVCDGLVVTGGETARQIVDALPALSLCVCREVLPGVALAMVDTAAGRFPMITKAGGFGQDDAFLVCLDALKGVGQ